MAWNIGANDTANSMSSAVGARALTLKQAVLIDGFFNLVGAIFVGSHVTNTVRKGIADPYMMGDPQVVMLGFFAVILGASIWVFVATWRELPVSTTHSVVGAVIGIGLLLGGVSAIKWGKLIGIVASWIISPAFSGLIAFIVMRIINRAILRKENSIIFAKKYSPYFLGVTFFIITASFLLKTPLGKELNISFGGAILIAIGIGSLIGYIGYHFVILRMKIDNAEQIFKVLQIITSIYIGFSVGANDVANAMGPVAAVRDIALTGKISAKVTVPVYILAFGGIGILVGTLTWGYKIIKTVGFKLTELTNTRGFAIDFGAATAVLLASKLGLPVSTTHSVVGAVVGVGLARGIEALDLSVIKRITLYWVLTVPFAALTAILIFSVIRVF